MKILRRYKYDPLDRLAGLQAQEQAFTQRFYQESDLVTELGEEDQQTIFRHGEHPLAQRQIRAGETETALLALDRAHSVLQVLSPKTRTQIAYSAYGHHCTESGLGSLLGFNGECPDAVTGQYLLGQGNRAFNPVLMRFNSPDELSPFGEGGINAYAYCENDPVNYFDPTGNSLTAIFRPWNRGNDPAGAINLIKKSVIIKKTQHRTYRTASSTSGSSPARNPILNSMLDKPISDASTSQLVQVNSELPNTDTLMSWISNSKKQKTNYKDLELTGQTHDNLKRSNSNFLTVATKRHLQKLDFHQASLKSAGDEIGREFHAEKISKIFLKIKKTSVNRFYAPDANQQIRS
jgi:RHS repeat-associated protein